MTRLGIRSTQTDTKYAARMAPKITGELKRMIDTQIEKHLKRIEDGKICTKRASFNR
jgi:hypothetical protein